MQSYGRRQSFENFNAGNSGVSTVYYLKIKIECSSPKSHIFVLISLWIFCVSQRISDKAITNLPSGHISYQYIFLYHSYRLNKPKKIYMSGKKKPNWWLSNYLVPYIQLVFNRFFCWYALQIRSGSKWLLHATAPERLITRPGTKSTKAWVRKDSN